MLHMQPHLSHSLRFNPRSRARGNAEIELLLVIPVLLLILLLIGGMLTLGATRLSFIFQNNQDVYQDATVAASPQWAQPSDVLLFDPGTNTEMDGLQMNANRVHIADSTHAVTIQTGNLNLPTVTLSSNTEPNMAEFISPAWAYSNWPVTSNGTQIQTAMQNYTEDAVGNVYDPLELAPSYPP